MGIRNYKSEDYSEVIKVYNNSKSEEFLYEKKVVDIIPLENDVARLEKLFESDIYVYDHNGIVAYGAIYNNEIRALFVHSSARRKGVGKRLFKFLLSRINVPIILYVAKSNLHAKNLYSQYGFVVTEEFTTNYHGRSITANKMTKKF